MKRIESLTLDRMSLHGNTFHEIEGFVDEIMEHMSKGEFADDSNFKSTRETTKNILNSLMKRRLVVQRGNKYCSGSN